MYNLQTHLHIEKGLWVDCDLFWNKLPLFWSGVGCNGTDDWCNNTFESKGPVNWFWALNWFIVGCGGLDVWNGLLNAVAEGCGANGFPLTGKTKISID